MFILYPNFLALLLLFEVFLNDIDSDDLTGTDGALNIHSCMTRDF